MPAGQRSLASIQDINQIFKSRRKPTENMRKIKAYLANQFGFSETGRHLLDSLIKPRIEKMGIIILDPFLECNKELDFKAIKEIKNHEEMAKYWADFSKKITPINNKLMENSDCLLAILDGGHAVDDGVAGEIGYYAGIKKGPIFALRSDLRCGENMAVTINPQLLGYIIQSRGKLIDSQNAVERWFSEIQKWRESKK